MLAPLPPPPEDDGGEDETMPLRTPVEVMTAGSATVADQRTQDMLAHQLHKLTFIKPPTIHDYPAPDAIPPCGDPTLSHNRPPVSSYATDRKTFLQRTLNTTIGRFSMFMATIVLINLGIFGLTTWNLPEYRKGGSSFYYFFIALFLFCASYTIPLLSATAGMNPLESGWKPFLVFWRLSLLTAIPACVLQVQGLGTQNAFGQSAGGLGSLKLQDLQNEFWNYFELADGFVALNLTKGIVETLAREEHGVKQHRRISRFRDAELRINREPYSDIPEPTETPGRLATYRIAPVFDNWAPCTSRYRISVRCLERNKVRAWAIAKSTSLCSQYKSVGCKPPKPYLEPIYGCSGPLGGVKGVETSLKIEGFCGHVTKAPPEGAIDELGALLLYDAWPRTSLPSANSLWLDVAPDECVGNPASCEEQWSQLYSAGLAFQIVSNILVLVSAFFDCKVDAKIRKARYWQMEEHRQKLSGISASTVGQLAK